MNPCVIPCKSGDLWHNTSAGNLVFVSYSVHGRMESCGIGLLQIIFLQKKSMSMQIPIEDHLKPTREKRKKKYQDGKNTNGNWKEKPNMANQ